MSKRFTITMAVCLGVFLALNVARFFDGPPAKVGVSGWRTIGAPFPVKTENVQYTSTGTIVTTVRDRGFWMWGVNVAFSLLMSWSFARWVDRFGAAWWRGEIAKPAKQ